MKKFINKWVLNYVSKNEGLQNEIVALWCGGNDIAKYYIKDSEVSLSNVNLVYSTITNCMIKEITNSILKDSPIHVNEID